MSGQHEAIRKRRYGRDKAVEGLLFTEFGSNVDGKEHVRRFRTRVDEGATSSVFRLWHVRRLFLAAAALLLAAAGLWIWRAEHPSTSLRAGGMRRMGGAARGTFFAKVADAEEKDGWRVLDGTKNPLAVGDAIRVGDRIETGRGKGLKLELDAGSWVRVQPHSKLAIPDSATSAFTLKLESGRLFAHAESSLRHMPLTILTPQARVVIKGTRFSMGVQTESTRLEVYQGLVGMERLSDGKSVDVAAGQFAVAEEGVELVARALPLRPGEASGSVAILADGECPPRTHLDGKVIFEDNFDELTGNWELVIGNPATGFSAATENAEHCRTIWKGKQSWDGGVKLDRPAPERGSDVTAMVVTSGLLANQDRKIFTGIRSARPITARRFVVEARMSFQNDGSCWFPSVEALERQSRTLARVDRSGTIPIERFYLHRWEIEPAQDSIGGDGLVIRWFLDGRFRESYRVTPLSTKLLFTYNKVIMLMDRVTVREFREDASQARGAGARSY